MRTYCIAHITLLSALWRPKWEEYSKRGDICKYIYVNKIHFAVHQKLTEHCKATTVQD